VLRNKLIWLRTLLEGAFGATALRPAIATPCFAAAARNRLARIGDVKLSVLDKVSFYVRYHHRCQNCQQFCMWRDISAGAMWCGGRLKLSSARANSPTGLLYRKQESPADAGIPARRKNDEKIPPFRSYNKFQSSRKSGVYSN